jgi:hypothetical protein
MRDTVSQDQLLRQRRDNLQPQTRGRKLSTTICIALRTSDRVATVGIRARQIDFRFAATKENLLR